MLFTFSPNFLTLKIDRPDTSEKKPTEVPKETPTAKTQNQDYMRWVIMALLVVVIILSVTNLVAVAKA